MLDFYLLADDQKIPNYPEATIGDTIGGLDYRTFERLKVKKIIPDQFDYYSDFRWDTALILQIRDNIQKQVLSDTDVQLLLKLLDKAKDNGLVAYAD